MTGTAARGDDVGKDSGGKDLEVRVYNLRVLEDRVLRLETVSHSLTDRYEQLRGEMRFEIHSLRDQMKSLEGKFEDSHRVVNGKLDRLIGGRAVVTALVTLATSVLGTGMVHVVLSLGAR